MHRAWLDHPRRLAFWGVPKCGTTSVISALNLTTDGHWCHPHEIPESYRTFSVLREPLSRIASAHQMSLRRYRATPGHLADCLRMIQRRGWRGVDNHLWPMAYYLKPVMTCDSDMSYPPTLALDFVTTMEEPAWWDLLCQWVGEDLRKPHLNPSPAYSADFNDRETRAMAAQLYWQDFAVYAAARGSTMGLPDQSRQSERPSPAAK